MAFGCIDFIIITYLHQRFSDSGVIHNILNRLDCICADGFYLSMIPVLYTYIGSTLLPDH